MTPHRHYDDGEMQKERERREREWEWERMAFLLVTRAFGEKNFC